jgi:type II secretory pathway component PulC
MEFNLSDRHIVALNFLLVTVLAYFAALAANDLFLLRGPTIDALAQSRRNRVASGASASRQRAEYQAIVERDIFNLEAPPPPPAPVVVEDLHLTLIGVSQATKGKPFAIIEDQGGEQSVYRVGEVIPDSGKLLEVGKDRAVIEHNGKPVVIELPTEEAGSPSDFAGAGEPMGRRLTVSEASGNDAMAHYRERLRRRFNGRQE